MALYSMKKPSADAEDVGFTVAAVPLSFAGSERKMESSALSRKRSSVLVLPKSKLSAGREEVL